MTQPVTLYSGKYIVEKIHPYHIRVVETGEILRPEGTTTIINSTLSKGDRFTLWPMYEALDYISKYLVDTPVEEVDYDVMIETASKRHSDKSTKGKDVGTEVHEVIEKFLTAHFKGEVSRDVVDFLTLKNKKNAGGAWLAVTGFINWFAKIKPKVLATEQVVYSPTYGYAGTFDALLEIDGKIVLADVKTSNKSLTAPLGIYDSYFLQLGAYSLAYHEEKRESHPLQQYRPGLLATGNEQILAKQKQFLEETRGVDDLMVINASKTGELNTLRASDLGLNVQFCEDAFLNCLKLHQFIKPLANQIKERTS